MLDKFTTPEIGEVRRGKEIGKESFYKCIWQACEKCGKERWVKFQKGKPEAFRCPACREQHGEKSSRWKGGRIKKRTGYIAIRLQPDDFFYPMVGKDGYAQEHRLVVAKALGRCLFSWEIVHHKRGFARDDNRYPETLQLLPSQAEHQVSIQFTRLYNKLTKRILLLEEENILLKKEIGVAR